MKQSKGKSDQFHLNSVQDSYYSKPWNAVGYQFVDLYMDSNHVTYQVVNERAVRAAAGLMMATAGLAVILAFFKQIYLPIRIFTVVAVFDFAVRQVSGLSILSPFGILGNFLVRNQRPEWAGAKQKLFAWALGLIMASFTAYLVNTGQNGPLSFTLCLICISLMWMEASLGICLGCKVYNLLLKWKIIPQPEVKPACPGGVCAIPSPLTRVPLFSSMNDAEISLLDSSADTVSYKEGDLLIKEGDVADSLYVILFGKVKVFTKNNEGDEIILNELGQGDYVGELALLDDEPRSASVMATKNTEVMKISKQDFKQVLDRHPGLSISLIKNLTLSVRSLSKTLGDEPNVAEA